MAAQAVALTRLTVLAERRPSRGAITYRACKFHTHNSYTYMDRRNVRAFRGERQWGVVGRGGML